MTDGCGILIGLAGIDGSGKSSQATLLVKWLKKCGFRVFLAKVKLHATLSVRKMAAVKFGDPQAYLPVPANLREFTMACDVVEYYFDVIEKKLKQGYIVVWDRGGPFSYKAYSAAWDADELWIQELYRLVPDPAISFLLDIPVDGSQVRLKKRRHTLPEVNERPEYLSVVRRILLQMAAAKKEILVLNANVPRKCLQEEIQRHLAPYLSGLAPATAQHAGE